MCISRLSHLFRSNQTDSSASTANLVEGSTTDSNSAPHLSLWGKIKKAFNSEDVLLTVGGVCLGIGIGLTAGVVLGLSTAALPALILLSVGVGASYTAMVIKADKDDNAVEQQEASIQREAQRQSEAQEENKPTSIAS